ncbi:hypothetical protein BTJ66_13320, partial [Staphylococcus edaphicus]
MNDNNQNTELLKQNNEYVKNYQQKIDDANSLTEQEFYSKYQVRKKLYEGKTVIAYGGNSQAGGSAKYQGVQQTDKHAVATNPAMLPLSSWDAFKRPYYKNVISYHSTYDMLSWLQDPFAKDIPANRVNLSNGVPTLEGLTASHLGYKRKFNEKDNTYTNLSVHQIKSVKDTEIKNGKTVPKTIDISLEMDDRIPINVWTGEAIATSGSGGVIKLDTDKLANLHQLVTGETSKMLTDCVIFLNESFNISEIENTNFGERKNNLKQDFKDKVFLDTLEELSRDVKSKANTLEHSIDTVQRVLAPIIGLVPTLGLNILSSNIKTLDKDLVRGIEAIHDTFDDILTELFKNLDHDFQDGVSEEMMKHLKIVSQNITQIKKQNDIYGQQIGDIQSIMSQQDATVMDGNLQINYSGTNMVTGQIESSNYLTRKMTVLQDHIDDAIKKLAEYVQELYNDYFKPVVDMMNEVVTKISSTKLIIQSILTILNTKAIKLALKASSITANMIIDALEDLTNQMNESKNVETRRIKRKTRTEIKKCRKRIGEYSERKNKYRYQQSILKDRNSYSKTDHDATFMRMKDD